jgi:hypothetical protein
MLFVDGVQISCGRTADLCGYGPPPTHPPEIRTSGVVVATEPGRIIFCDEFFMSTFSRCLGSMEHRWPLVTANA